MEIVEKEIVFIRLRFSPSKITWHFQKREKSSQTIQVHFDVRSFRVESLIVTKLDKELIFNSPSGYKCGSLRDMFSTNLVAPVLVFRRRG